MFNYSQKHILRTISTALEIRSCSGISSTFILCIIFCCLLTFQSCEISSSTASGEQERKYILYDVNFGEGFNLRRDVFMRIANAVRRLREDGYNYTLVLPPWGGLYHWTKGDIKIPWSQFFQISSINEFVPVMEFRKFLRDANHHNIDQVIYLQGYLEGWESGKYELKYEERSCIDGQKYYKLQNGLWKGWFFSYESVSAHNFTCISIQGDSNTLVSLIKERYKGVQSLMIDRAETVLHSHFGDYYYWEARRSMRYAVHLLKIADNFRKKHLNSDDLSDKTELPDSWRESKKRHGDARGGNFICVHWRRRDFVKSHSKDVPSINGTAQQIIAILTAKKQTTIFLSTDAPSVEVATLINLLPSKSPVVQFRESDALSDGEVSIIDQWICAHASFFIGTHLSTFSYRVQEDREILGFHPTTTFNRLCPDRETNCEQPTKWTIVYNTEEDE